MNRLQTWMQANGLKDREIAERIGGEVSREQISKIRRGKSRPSPTTADRLEKLTGIPAWEFVRPEETAA